MRGGVVATPLLSIITFACLIICLLLSYRPILDLPEYKLKLVNIYELHVIRGPIVVVFDQFQPYVEIVWKLMKTCDNSFIFNSINWIAQVRCKLIEITLQYQIVCLILVFFMVLAKTMGQNPYRSIVSAQIWWRHCDVVFSCILINFFTNLYWYYLTPFQN